MELDKITKIQFDPDQDYIWDIQGLEQWDQGQKLEISGLDISDEIVEVHFSLDEVRGKAKRMLGVVNGGVIHADIPAFILEGPEHIFCNNDTYSAYAWIYVSDDESAETIRKMEFTIKARPKPEEYVKPDEPDTFIGQIKKIMNETKDIAQSVRDDADNGEFDGEKGPKGDAGSIEFKIVNELPTENISESTMYLVPLSPGTEQNEFAEYIYVDGHWEYIGSASVEVDLSEYVKKDDYATTQKAGLVKTDFDFGLGLLADGKIYVRRAQEQDVDNKTNGYKPIVPNILDYAVMKALSDSKLEWTEEEKAKALELLGGQAKINDTLGGVASARIIANDKSINVNIYSRGSAYKEKLLCGSATGFGLIESSSITRTQLEKQLGDYDETKGSLQSQIGSVESILTELHTHAESLIGGEA